MYIRAVEIDAPLSDNAFPDQDWSLVDVVLTITGGEHESSTDATLLW